MIISPNKYKTAKSCWRKAFNYYHAELRAEKRSTSLVDGSATHQGIAEGLASRNWERAREVARAAFDQEIALTNILPEQSFLIEDHWNLVDTMINSFKENWKDQSYTVIQPECEFTIDLPDSMHECVWPDPDELFHQPDPVYAPPNRPKVPHQLHGKTDAIISWNNTVWIVDQKTTSISGNQFWDQWGMDFQMTAYVYGVWKALGIKPRGFIINALVRPSEAQVSNWNSKRKNGPPRPASDYVKFEREAFLRSDEDLEEFEREVVQFGDEWEHRIRKGWWGRTTASGSCLAYNRRCDYYQMCLTHGKDSAGLVQLEHETKVEEVVEG